MKNIKVGVFGAGRGCAIALNFAKIGAKIIAICDNHKVRRDEAIKRLELLNQTVTPYDNFDDFIKEDMDAIIIANNFYQHAPYVIKCLEKNIHIFCECISNATMGEGVEIVRAFEKSKSI